MVGGITALLDASTVQQQVIGFVAVLLGAGNAAGGYAATDRMLAMFKTSGKPAHVAKNAAKTGHGAKAKRRAAAGKVSAVKPVAPH